MLRHFEKKPALSFLLPPFPCLFHETLYREKGEHFLGLVCSCFAVSAFYPSLLKDHHLIRIRH